MFSCVFSPDIFISVAIFFFILMLYTHVSLIIFLMVCSESGAVHVPVGAKVLISLQQIDHYISN